MRVVLPLLALILTTAAAPQTPPVVPAPGTAIEQPPAEAVCRDRIIQARQERGLPPLRRETATPDEPLFIAAVDKRIDGCSVLVMRNNTSDIRPLPVIEDKGRLERIPAR